MRVKSRASFRAHLLGASSRALIVVAAALGGFDPSAHAQEANQQISDGRISFDIPAQPLSSALSEFARQSGVRVLFAYNDLNGARAPALRGAFTREQALAHLLAGSSFAGSIDNAGVVRLEQRPRPQPIGAEAPLQDLDRPQQRPSIPQSLDTGSDGHAANDEEEIVVTGTRIRGAAPVGANVQTLDRDDIDQTGRSTLQDVLQVLPQNFPGSQTELSQQAALDARRNIAFGSTVDLRGLGADATLSLVNGRRLAPAGFGNFVDISGVPLAAVERIEILPDGASATYGASWIEATHGAGGGARRAYTGLFTIRFERPRSADALARNPLGLFITEFSFSPEASAVLRGDQP